MVFPLYVNLIKPYLVSRVQLYQFRLNYCMLVMPKYCLIYTAKLHRSSKPNTLYKQILFQILSVKNLFFSELSQYVIDENANVLKIQFDP